MNKILPIFVIGILVISGLGAVAIQENEGNEDNVLLKVEFMLLSEPIIKEKDNYLTVDLKESTSFLLETGKPVVPVIAKTFTFPVGTRISKVDVIFEVEKLKLSNKIRPSPQPVPLSTTLVAETKSEAILDKEVYGSAELYPSEQYTIQKGVGLKNQEHVLYLTVRCNAQYSPATDTINIPRNIEIKIEYIPPEKPLFAVDEYDLLIITDESFVSGLQPLVEHKNSIGVKTIIETVQDIYPAYNGRDKAEDIKLCIKDAIEEWGIEYVLLAGGRKGQTFEWYIPSRTVHNDDGWEKGYESDLYYSDIYKIENNETVFEDWDSDGDGIIGEYKNFIGGDQMDYYPDVTVGRLPFRSESEVAPMVEKIIDYETNADDSWFKKAVVISGDTFPPSRGGAPGWYEGEIETGHTVDLLESIGFTVQKLWLTIPGAWTGPEDVINAISAGAGFVHFAGHSNPASWGNHPPDDEDHVFVDGIRIWDMPKLSNTGKYPVVMLGGCHSAQFNVTMSNIIAGILEYGIGGYFFKQPFRFYYYEWVPRDLCSWFVLEKDGGAIASIGNSGLGYGYVNEDADAGLGGWIEPRFFENYVNQSIDDNVGKIHDSAIVDYINIIGNVNTDQIDRKTIEEWTLLGDPSLKVGGI